MYIPVAMRRERYSHLAAKVKTNSNDDYWECMGRGKRYRLVGLSDINCLAAHGYDCGQSSLELATSLGSGWTPRADDQMWSDGASRTLLHAAWPALWLSNSLNSRLL